MCVCMPPTTLWSALYGLELVILTLVVLMFVACCIVCGSVKQILKETHPMEFAICFWRFLGQQQLREVQQTTLSLPYAQKLLM